MKEKRTVEFKAEMKQLLDLLIHSLYSNKDVFLRELVSNASDALSKVKFKTLLNEPVADASLELRIDITADKESMILTIEDTGIGLTEDDLISKIGTVASSGTLKFLNEMKDNKTAFESELIGRFGVGFYSVFMVTDEVTIETRSADENSPSLRWVSDGEETFTIEETESRKRGTKIGFRIKDDCKEYLEPYKLRSLLSKYSNFIEFPIYLNGEQVNGQKPLWQRSKDTVSQDEYDDFYKFLAGNPEAPMSHLHLNLEGNVEFKALLYIPQQAPANLFALENEKSLHLYVNKVFIQDNAKDFLPDYLRFFKGVIDTPDLPLNVSREFAQSDPVISRIRTSLTGRILSHLEEMAAKDTEKYKQFYSQFGTLVKTGINSDFMNRDRIISLLRFPTSRTTGKDDISLADYVERMPASQEEIIYSAGSSVAEIDGNPNMEYFKRNEIEVIYLTDPVDIFIIPGIFEFKDKKLVSIEKASIAQEPESENAYLPENLMNTMKEMLKDRVEEVRESSRLVSYPVTLVAGKDSPDPQMERMMQMMDKDYKGSKKIFEVNPAHPVIKRLNELMAADKQKAEMMIEHLYETAALMNGELSSASEYARRAYKLMGDI